MKLSSELPVSRCEVVEINIDIARKQYKFGDIVNLRNKKIRVIDIFRVSDVTVTNNENPVVADVVFNKSTIILASNGKEVINRVPLTVFNPKDNYGRRILLNDLIIDWPKSYIEVGSLAGIVVGQSYFMSVYYED